MIVVMYSINVFLTFTPLAARDVRPLVEGAEARSPPGATSSRSTASGSSLTATILVVTVGMKFLEGGWVTVVITGSLVGLCVLMRRHYRSIRLLLKRTDDVLTTLPKAEAERLGVLPEDRAAHRGTPTAVFLVSGFNGLGIHSFLNVQTLLPEVLQERRLPLGRRRRLGQLQGVGRDGEPEEGDRAGPRSGTSSTRGTSASRRSTTCRVGTDLLDELVELCREVRTKYDRPIFFTSKLVFPQENFANRLLHNQTPFAAPAPPPDGGDAFGPPADPGLRPNQARSDVQASSGRTSVR